MDARLREGIRLFNAGLFFESHEVWESFYCDAEEQQRPFLEGLIQLAAAFRIFADFGETAGPARMIYQALIRFENYQPSYLEIRVRELTEAVESWAREAEKGGGKPFAVPKISHDSL
jgi:predicted metal-dependent hydrolase